MNKSDTYFIVAMLWLILAYQQSGALALLSCLMAVGNFIASAVQSFK